MKKEKLLYFLKEIIDWLTHFYNKFSKKKSNLSSYHPLSPTDDAENIDYYIESLDWALQNRCKIKNIAISGPYGSGKSSVIQTFQKRNKNKDYKFLNISLATFKEEKTEEKKSKKTYNEDILRLIELSILQQLFYLEKDKNIPDSRFKKIKSFSIWHLGFLTIGFVTALISFLYLVFPKFLEKFSLITITQKYSNLIHFLAVIILFTGLLFILFKLTRIIKGIVIKKLSLNNASIEIDGNISKSILNNHLDEILYFFEVTKYNTVIIEDIDRFEQTEVFTKLRELNLLINNSKKIKDDIIFIYAIRDDMFKDKDRTKFFDFMIPIIPVINSSNSNEKLLGIIKNNDYKISNDLVSNISLFIDDMRLLYNIMNEYYIYSKNLNPNLNQDKLLSMIVYKNIHPIDFTELSNNGGTLYNTLSKKHLYIQEKNEKIDKEIFETKERIEKSEGVKLNNIKELRTIYLSKIIEKINNSNYAFHSFKINNVSYKISQATEDEIFPYFIDNTTIQYQYQNQTNYLTNFTYDFKGIEKEINPVLTYREREQLILNNNRIDSLKKKVEDLEEKKNLIKKYKIQELLSDKEIIIDSLQNKQNELISILLRNGYIDEDYLDYISIFYEGSLSKVDHQFLINVKTQIDSDFDYKLNKIENLLKKINLLDFEKGYILNYSLLDFLLSNNKQKIKRDTIFIQLKNEIQKSVNFIDGFIQYTSQIELFIQLLCKQWTNIWNYIENESGFSEEKKANYFKLIIDHADIKDIKAIFDNYKSIISNNKNFLSITKNTKKIKEIIKILIIRFEDTEESSPKDLLEFIYSENYYSLNPTMLKSILTFYSVFNQNEFDEKNYSTIKQSKIEPLIKNIEKNINEYISSIYLKIESNIKEPLDSLVNLLNNKDVTIKNKNKIIKQTETKIEDITEIENQEVINLLLNESKVSANWGNITSIYIENENKLSEDLISFINSLKNAERLSKNKISKEYPDEESAKNFIREILLEDSFNDACYLYLLKSIPFIYDSLDFENLSFEKVKLLVDNKILVVNNTNFELLKENFDKLHISLIENDPNKFIEDIISFELDNDDLLSILESIKVTIAIKVKVINNFDTSTFTTDSKLLNKIGLLLIENLNIVIDNIIINSVITKSELTNSQKLVIFNKYNTVFKKNEIETFLLSLGEPYSNIAENGKRPLIDYNTTNEEFVTILKRKEYISKYEIKQKGVRIFTFRNK